MLNNDKPAYLSLQLIDILDRIDEMQCLITAASLCDSYLENKTLSDDLLEAYKEKIDELIKEYKYLDSTRIKGY